ncbi:MAG: NAD(+)/NADH kinase, partial [Oscillospiraceae bacterium]|nr:NAD(+)/NADH kinase [Oscillospiraceae bacterium]
MRLGVLINPVAGMGGAVGLKGTDGAYGRAVALGAAPNAENAATEAFSRALPELARAEILCGAGHMGERALSFAGIIPKDVFGEDKPLDKYTAADTIETARELERRGADWLLFAGGDGTARDVLDSGISTPVLAIPTGVKMYSAVFAAKPALAGRLLGRLLRGSRLALREAEIMDLDEDAYRGGIVAPRLYGYLRTVSDAIVRGGKMRSALSETSAQQDIALQIAQDMTPGVMYLLGPGSTTAALSRELGTANTLIGFDAVMDGQLLAADVNESQILELIGQRPSKLVVTPIGGQGILFGRGNKQI